MLAERVQESTSLILISELISLASCNSSYIFLSINLVGKHMSFGQ